MRMHEQITTCCQEVETRFGRSARRRFERLIENNSTDHDLSSQEIQALRERFENELSRG
jgi:hypothetical protein